MCKSLQWWMNITHWGCGEKTRVSLDFMFAISSHLFVLCLVVRRSKVHLVGCWQLLCQLKKKVPPCPLTMIPMLQIIPICDVISYISRGMPVFFLLHRIRPCCMANSVHRITLFQSLLLIPGKYAPILQSVSSSGRPNERPKWQD